MPKTAPRLPKSDLKASGLSRRRTTSSATRLKLPGFGQPIAKMTDYPSAGVDWKANTICLREQAMLWFIDKITDKPEWERKVFDDEIVQKWKTELEGFVAAEKEAARRSIAEGELPEDVLDAYLSAGFTDTMFNNCIKELKEKAGILKSTKLVSIFDNAAMVVKSDLAVSEDLREALCAAVKPLEDVPDEQKDWHPGSDDLVLDLVHPSLFPLVYGKTRILPDRRLGLDDCLEAWGSGETIPVQELDPANTWWHRLFSDKFQWLPCEVQVTDGVAKIESYINNLHPVQHRALYPVIEQVITAAIPAVASVYDRVTSWEGEMGQRQRILIDENEAVDVCTHDEPCADGWISHENAPMYPDDEEIEWGSDEWDEAVQKARNWFEENHEAVHPDAGEYVFHGSRFDLDACDQWKNKRLQVIVKLANIELTPEKPKYGGGSQHIEGLLNERICATALYYYDSDNITESKLGFSTESNCEPMEDNFHMMQNEHRIFMRWFGIPGNGHIGHLPAVMDVGAVTTQQGRLVVFPNVLQHRVWPFELADKTRPGHRKILALFFVVPDEPIISTAHIPPQQQSWGSYTEVESRLPPELTNEVYDNLGCPYSLTEAKRLRLELMEERKAADDEAEITMDTWGFCEH